MSVTIAIAPATRPAMAAAFRGAVEAAGGRISALAAAEGLIWADPARAVAFPEIIAQAPSVRWIQLPYAGIEPFATHLDERYTWTCAKGVYAPPVAEHVLALTLAGLRGVHTYARATTWAPPQGHNLFGAAVTVFGGGGICRAVMAAFAPFDCRFTVVRRSSEPIDGAGVVGPETALEAVHDADVVILALALTPQTGGLVDQSFLAAMAPHAWLVNVARGPHIVTDDLVAVLAEERIGGAALDVTDPEPLPVGHPLWSEPRCLITPHTANTAAMAFPLLSERVRENVARFVRGEKLLGVVDVAAGY